MNDGLTYKRLVTLEVAAFEDGEEVARVTIRDLEPTGELEEITRKTLAPLEDHLREEMSALEDDSFDVSNYDTAAVEFEPVEFDIT